MSSAKPQKPSRPAPKPFSPEVRERAVCLVLEHPAEYESQWAAIRSLAEKIGCSAEALRTWVRRVDARCPGEPSLRLGLGVAG